MIDAVDLAREIAELSQTLRQPLPKDPEALLLEADYRSGWLARVGEIEADAQMLLDKKRGEVADLHSKLSATLIKEKLKGETADLARLVMLAHRMYSTLTEQIELIRTMVSYAKAERSR
jgi:hypothetical protein